MIFFKCFFWLLAHVSVGLTERKNGQDNSPNENFNEGYSNYFKCPFQPKLRLPQFPETQS